MRIPDKYYGLHPVLAWFISIFLAIIGIGAMIAVLEIEIGLGFVGDLLGIFLIAPLLMLLMTPVLRVVGSYKYYSPLFLVFGESETRMEIHSGPSIDYLLHLRGVDPGPELQRTVLAFYLQGLLNIADKVAAAEDSSKIEIVGTSYFFSDRSVERMGFGVSPGGLTNLMSSS